MLQRTLVVNGLRVISLRCSDLSVFAAKRTRLRHPPGFAAKLCTKLERFRLTCQPTIFAGRHLAMD